MALLEARGIVRTYGSVIALDGADFDIEAGEITALIGDNGAGKSTLVKVLSGTEVAEDGTVHLDGKLVRFTNPSAAREHGIETVFQTLAVAPALDIASNLFLGREVRKKGFMGTVFRQLDKKGMRRQATEHLESLGISTLQDITQAVETLSGGQRQAVLWLGPLPLEAR